MPGWRAEKILSFGSKTALDRFFAGPYSPPRHDGRHMGGLEGASRCGDELRLLKCLHQPQTEPRADWQEEGQDRPKRGQGAGQASKG